MPHSLGLVSWALDACNPAIGMTAAKSDPHAGWAHAGWANPAPFTLAHSSHAHRYTTQPAGPHAALAHALRPRHLYGAHGGVLPAVPLQAGGDIHCPRLHAPPHRPFGAVPAALPQKPHRPAGGGGAVARPPHSLNFEALPGLGRAQAHTAWPGAGSPVCGLRLGLLQVPCRGARRHGGKICRVRPQAGLELLELLLWAALAGQPVGWEGGGAKGVGGGVSWRGQGAGGRDTSQIGAHGQVLDLRVTRPLGRHGLMVCNRG